MPATSRFEPDAVAATSFPVVRRGYDADEVRAYLQSVAAELSRLHREVESLGAELAARPKEVASLDEGMVAQMLGEEAARVLTTAREAAAQIRTRAEEAAAAMVGEANQDAARQREEADVEAARVRQDAATRADAEIEAAKAEGREMVAEARAVRERMMADLQRRKEVARGQLEQMRLGHERVMGTFELAAEALASINDELRALAPDVRRNATVDTGPVPTVPGDVAHDLPARPAVDVAGLLESPVEEHADESVEVTPTYASVGSTSAVHVSVPARSVADGSEVAPDGDADAGEPEPPRPTVLVSAFSLGEVAPVAEPVAVAEPEPVLDDAVAEQPVDEELDLVAEPVADVESEAAVLGSSAAMGGIESPENDEEPALEPEAAAATAAGEEPAAVAEEPIAVPVSDEPIADEPLSDEPVAVAEPVADEPVADEPVATEDPLAVDEPVAAEPVAEEPTAEPVVTEDPLAVDEPVATDEPAAVEAEAHGDDRHRPSADDLFARIRAARANLASDATDLLQQASQPATPKGPPTRHAAPEPDVAAAVARSSAATAVALADATEVIAARAASLAGVEGALSRRLKRALADEQNEVLDRLRRKNPVLELDALVGTIDEHAEAYRRVVRDELWPALAAGARSLRPELTDDEVRELLGDRVADSVVAEVADEVVNPLRERIARLLAGTSEAPVVSDGLRTLYREWKTQRLDATASLLALAAHGRAAYAVLVPGTSVCWLVDPAKPCPDGEDNALAGPNASGEPFPTGHLCAPAYVGCRCVLAPAAR